MSVLYAMNVYDSYLRLSESSAISSRLHLRDESSNDCVDIGILDAKAISAVLHDLHNDVCTKAQVTVTDLNTREEIDIVIEQEQERTI